MHRVKRACIAVGSYVNKLGKQAALAEEWNGTSWVVQSAANPAGSSSVSLSGVSCTASSACIAVGFSLNSVYQQVPLAETWNGSAWAESPVPIPTGAQSAQLSSLSCPTPTACSAVGSFTNSAYQQFPLAEVWNGSAWVLQSAPNPSGALGAGLNGVSCRSTTACTAIGFYTNTGYPQWPLAEAWNGTKWAVQSVPNPTGAQGGQLSGVSCTASTVCTAVGFALNGGYQQIPLADARNGTVWSVQSTPSPTGAQSSEFSGVSCTASSACVAVGSSTNGVSRQLQLAEAWNGSKWAVESTPNPSAARISELSGVSCTTPTACTAVGSYSNSSNQQLTLVEVWNGTAWAIQPSPTPGGALGAGLVAVSCRSQSACTAVGFFTNSAYQQVPLAEVWNGSSWVVQSTPNPVGAQSSELSGVSCTTPTACIAVGLYTNSAYRQLPLAEVWNGTTWSLQTVPNPGGPSSVLTAVSCTASSACTSVGYYTNSAGQQVTLAERWNGIKWVVQVSASGDEGGMLNGVSCAAAGSCTAVGVGYDYGFGSPAALAEVWNGTAWTAQTVPRSTGDTSSGLNGVSCISDTACATAGYQILATQVPLVEAEGGAWNSTASLVRVGVEGRSHLDDHAAWLGSD